MPRLLRFLHSTRIARVCAVATLCVPAYVHAQTPDSGAALERLGTDPPAHVSFVDGPAVLERDGQPDSAPANMPLLAGDRIRTQAGRVEILFADGSTLHLDANTIVDFQSDELVRLLDGRVRLSIPGPASRRVAYRIDAPPASALILQPGAYKLSILHSTRDGEIELAVLRGAAELVNDDGRTALRAGERAYARANMAPSYAYAYNSAAWDEFDRWSEARHDQRLGISTQYLPEEVRPYANSFDQYGTWQYEPVYGYVWYPRVAAGWRPYYRGRWVTLRPYGWTWVGLDPFAWPTHHFGRWGFSAGTWFWIPGRTWGPAWVSWAYAPGYVSWCPLGWNNSPVFHLNVFTHGYDPWHAWTVIPRQQFGVSYVHVHYVGASRFDSHVAPTFVPRYTPPASTGYAVPRASAPIRVAGTVAPGRSSSIVYTNLEPSASRVPSGGRRVIVGEPRNSVAPAQDATRRSAAQSGTERTRDGSYAVRRGTAAEADRGATISEEQRRSLGIAGVPSSREDTRDDPNVRRAVPRNLPASRTPTPSAPIFWNDGHATPSSTDRPAYPAGMAVPRGSQDAAGSSTESRPSGGFERRGPGTERPQGPPPGGAGPTAQPREYRSTPSPPPASGGGDHRGPGSGAGQGPPPAPATAGDGGHQRGGGQSTGRAVPRGGR